ncbi:MAG: metallophosphoesterase [Chloroflexi bacterium]|nr:metallophosphoesterase [Chloroflexota bacterium]
MSSKLSRRDFLKIAKFFGASALASFAGTYYMTEIEPSWLEVSQVEIPLGALPKAFDGYRIVQISDIHIGGWMNRERLSTVVELVLEQKPDLVVATGDFLIGHSWSDALEIAIVDFVDVILPLTQTYKVIGVMGNHDHWTNVERVREMLIRAGVLELRNDVHRLDKDGESLYIAGVDDVHVGANRLEDVLSKLSGDTQALLLAHEPDYADIISETGRFFLQLSGHSHGGQVVLPFLGPLVLPYWARNYPSGLYDVHGMYLYTNRGVGMTDPFVRFNCRPEITVFTLNGPE